MTKLTPTGRFPTNPEMQNLPGSPAHALEMYYARHGAPKVQWETSAEVCPRCEREHVEYLVIDIGPDGRYLYRCNDCNHTWWGQE